MSSHPYVKALFAGTSIIGFGYLLMKFSTPTREQIYEKLPPEVKHSIEGPENQERMKQIMTVMRKAAETDKTTTETVYSGGDGKCPSSPSGDNDDLLES
nr:11807_t:CDS:2 [Entrophospora candida]CAG8511767.1 12784_t:CDS:2 [Entrophospora candida]